MVKLTRDLKQLIDVVPGREMEIIIPSFHIQKEDPPSIIDMLSADLVRRYRRRLSPTGKQDITLAFWEALTNASYHGNNHDKNKKVTIGIWFGKHGVAFSFKDEGNYYRQQSTKDLLEARRIAGGDGMKAILKADIIFVCLARNTLYFAFCL